MRLVSLRVLLVLCFVTARAAAQSAGCDSSLDPTPDAEGYQPRAGSRCEGTYVSRVSGPALELVSLTWGALPAAVQPGGMVLTLPTAADRPGPVHIRALGIPPGLYYRMDAEVPPGGSVTWPPTAVLDKLKIGLSEVGVFGFARDPSGEIVYLPVAINGPAGIGEGMVVQLRPLTTMDEAKWRFVAQGTSPGEWTGTDLKDDRLTIPLRVNRAAPPGTLQVSWTDPETGRSRIKSFELRP